MIYADVGARLNRAFSGNKSEEKRRKWLMRERERRKRLNEAPRDLRQAKTTEGVLDPRMAKAMYEMTIIPRHEMPKRCHLVTLEAATLTSEDQRLYINGEPCRCCSTPCRVSTQVFTVSLYMQS
jgi:hypothetical protein